MHILNYIGGDLREPVGGGYMDNVDPATAAALGRIPDSDARDVEEAVNAAESAFPDWSSLSAQERSEFLLRIADMIEERQDELALAESDDTGKPVALAESVDIPRAASNFRFYATAIEHFASESHAMGKSALNYTLRGPIGIAGCISPWNLPLYLLTWKIAPALAAGNCVIGKPSELTPTTAFLLSGICREAGLPAGVLNIVHGYGHKAGAAAVEHPRVHAVSFTGGTDTGRKIAAAAAPLFKRVSLELGGKNPNIVFADCPYEDALQTALLSSFSNQGEICLCGPRIFIERPLYDTFRDDFVERTRQLPVGDPRSAGNRLGAVVSADHMDKILAYIELARNEGGRVLCGGHRVRENGRCRDGWFVAPTVIEGLPPDCRTNQEEIFGPVVSLLPFDTEEDVITQANGTPYGLAAMLWTENLGRAHRVAERLHAGIIWINCWMLRDLRTPFGGMKQSGVGREGGIEALRFFTEPKNVCIRM